MDKLSRRRMAVLLTALAILLGVFVFRLIKLGTEKTDNDIGKARPLTYLTTVEAARGEIRDRNGVVLVTNRPSYRVTIINFVFFSGPDPNGALYELAALCRSRGLEIADHLPISQTQPYVSRADELSAGWNGYFRDYLIWREWDPEITPENMIRRMRETYHLPDEWSDEEARAVIGIRYELDLRYFTTLENYALVSDLSTDDLAALSELNVPGVITEITTSRVVQTPYAAHLLGNVGSIYPEEWPDYQQQGYAMNASVGRDGAEKAFESYLHGKSGTRYTTVLTDGTVTDSWLETEPEAGSNVYLSIDIGMQAVAEEKLAEVIRNLQQKGVGGSHEGTDAKAGAVVAIACKTGEVLASANYPTYDLMTYAENYTELANDPTSPLWNRAMLATYNPGSIYKMVTSIAAVDRGGISRWRQIEDKGAYTYYSAQNYICYCHIFTSSGTTHGVINMMEALSVSCNYYFYEVGREIGIASIDEVAAALGLGEPTGIELPEETGTRANPDTKKRLYDEDHNGWYAADTLQAAIGQSNNSFTPLQLAQYAATLANKGTRYRATLLSRVVSWDYSSQLYTHRAEILSQAKLSGEAIAVVRDGMKLAASEGTASTYFRDYPVAVAGKTGTAQHGSLGSDNASFLCFAPADDPEIAVAVYVERGAQGGNLGQVARAILDYYFARSASSALPVSEPENAVR